MQKEVDSVVITGPLRSGRFKLTNAVAVALFGLFVAFVRLLYIQSTEAFSVLPFFASLCWWMLVIEAIEYVKPEWKGWKHFVAYVVIAVPMALLFDYVF